MSTCSNFSRLQSYGSGTDYICFFGVDNCVEVEKAIISAFSVEFDLDHGKEYFRISDKEKGIELFTTIVNQSKKRR